jgi:hypothetical protein
MGNKIQLKYPEKMKTVIPVGFNTRKDAENYIVGVLGELLSKSEESATYKDNNRGHVRHYKVLVRWTNNKTNETEIACERWEDRYLLDKIKEKIT